VYLAYWDPWPLCLCGSAFAQFQMPDPKQMAGIPRPLMMPSGSVSVRLIRGQLSNNIADHRTTALRQRPRAHRQDGRSRARTVR
jgi:hypothetical protein